MFGLGIEGLLGPSGGKVDTDKNVPVYLYSHEH